MSMTAPLPPGYSVRTPTLENIGAIAGLLNACAVAEHGEPVYTAKYLRSLGPGLAFSQQPTPGWSSRLMGRLPAMQPSGSPGMSKLQPRSTCILSSAGWGLELMCSR